MAGSVVRPKAVDRRAALARTLAGAASVLVPGLARAQDKDPPPAASIESIDIDARPILHFERSRPDVKRFGQLEFRGGLVLGCASPNFGGWSGLVMEADGKSLLAISDVGNWMTADVVYTGTRPTGFARAKLGPLLGSRGQPLQAKREQDAEGVTLVDGTLKDGTLLISFERLHRIGRFPIRDGKVLAPTGYLKMPADAKGMRENQGIEGVTVLKGGPNKGAVVAFAERLTRGSGYHTGWIWIGTDAQKFQLQDIDGFNITDTASLADGSLLVLERFFRWSEGVKMRLRYVPAHEIAPGARISGRILFEGDSSYEIDNMEGLAVHQGSGGATVVSLISDDNFNHLLQRTLFLQFTLLGEGQRNATRR
jgi:hypothetical protein